MLEAAARAPSGGNVQPWHIDVVAGSKLDELKAMRTASRSTATVGSNRSGSVVTAAAIEAAAAARITAGVSWVTAIDPP